MWHQKTLKNFLKSTCLAFGAAAMLIPFMATGAHAQSGTLVTSGMGGGASSTARLQAQVTNMQNRLSALEVCGNKSMLFGPSYGGATDADGCTQGLTVTGDTLYATNNMRVGSGVAPTEALDVTGNALISGNLTVTDSFNTTAGRIILQPQNTTNEGGELLLQGAGTNDNFTMDNLSGRIRFYSPSAATGEQLAVFTTGVRVGGGATVTEKFHVNGNAVVDGSIGLHDFGGRRYTFGDTASSEPTGIVLRPDLNPGAGDALFVVQSGSMAERLRVEHGGVVSSINNFQGPGFFYSSDRRLKKNMAALDGEDVLEKLMQLDGTFYEWKDADMPEGRQVGFVAQDVEKVFPELVRNNVRRQDGEDYKSVSYGQMTAPLVEAVKALKKRNDALEAELADLKERVNALAK